MVRAGLQTSGADVGTATMTEHGSATPSSCCRCPGCPSSGPATTWPRRWPLPHRGCATATSSWSPARWCPSARAVSCRRPPIREARDDLRRKLIDAEAVRVLARKGQTLITENALGLVQAAAGIDGSNVGSTELALLPVDPDGSAATLRARLSEQLGVTVGVLITDTMGRAWRNGQTDVAIGAAGVGVLHAYAGAHDAHGNELVVTEIAMADEIAAAADLVKGKLTGIPVAVVRGLPTD